MRALGYIRVSTEEQRRSGHSLAMQPRQLQQWAELRELELVDVVRDEGVSAGLPLDRRRGGAELLRRLRAGEAQALVVYRLDRLFRDALDGLLFFRQVAEPAGVVVHSVSELIDTSTPAGKLNLTISLGAAEYERDLACERTRAVSASLRQQGRAYGHAPYGVVAVGPKGEQRLYQDPDTWPIRELIVAMRRGRHNGHSRAMSYADIAAVLNEQGVASPMGYPWWSKQSIRRVVDTHGGLDHIPPLPAAPEAEVSAA